jgi:glyoxalase family protein
MHIQRLKDKLGNRSNASSEIEYHGAIAWRVGDDDEQQTMQARLTAAGFQVSSVRDRQYFRSIYYRERGGILFEIATDTPGFAVDEDPSTLGQALKLPPQFESARAEIERALPALA